MENKIILYVILAIIIIGLLIITFFPNIIYTIRDSGQISTNGIDKCSPPAGQTEEAWQEHMSHHPDIYKECLS